MSCFFGLTKFFTTYGIQLRFCEIPEARDEYTSYAQVVFSLLKRGGSVEEVSKYLKDIRIVHMGVGPPETGNEDDIAEIVINRKETILDE